MWRSSSFMGHLMTCRVGCMRSSVKARNLRERVDLWDHENASEVASQVFRPNFANSTRTLRPARWDLFSRPDSNRAQDLPNGRTVRRRRRWAVVDNNQRDLGGQKFIPDREARLETKCFLSFKLRAEYSPEVPSFTVVEDTYIGVGGARWRVLLLWLLQILQEQYDRSYDLQMHMHQPMPFFFGNF